MCIEKYVKFILKNMTDVACAHLQRFLVDNFQFKE